MTKYLAGVLSVIAVGTLLIAYGLLNPRVATADGVTLYPADRAQMLDRGPEFYPVAQRVGYPASAFQPASIVDESPVPRRAVVTRPVRDDQERPIRTVRRAPQRDWKKTAMIIGGSSAAGAGLGALIGGKKGALIGAAIAGGGAGLWETTKRR